jgi:hypothetical protein
LSDALPAGASVSPANAPNMIRSKQKANLETALGVGANRYSNPVALDHESKIILFKPIRNRMSTRCNVVLHHKEQERAMLYKHSDGMPEVMVGQLIDRLRRAHNCLAANSMYTGDAEKLAAMLVALSIDESGVPGYQPCLITHGDISYRYDIYIQDSETYELRFVDDGVRHSYSVHCGPGDAEWELRVY